MSVLSAESAVDWAEGRTSLRCSKRDQPARLRLLVFHATWAHGLGCGNQTDPLPGATIKLMYHYDPNTALEELTEDATLPNPVHVRDMILRKHPGPDKSLELNRMFVEYQKFFGETEKLGKEILKQLAS